MVKNLNAIGYAWHTPHQYELGKVGFKYDLIPSKWDYAKRPMPKNIRMMDDKEFVELKNQTTHKIKDAYDLAILHFGVNDCKNFLFNELLCLTRDIPKIIICHGDAIECNNIMEAHQKVGEHLVICNSKTSEERWNFPNSKTIIHGMDPEEWKQTDYSKNDVLTILSNPVRNYTRYGWGVYHKVKTNANAKFTIKTNQDSYLINDYKEEEAKNFKEYQDRLSKSSIYFNPTLNCSMPRARTEAMMSGLAVVSTRENDWGELGNGMINPHEISALVPETEEMMPMIDWLQQLNSNPDLTKKIGKKCREHAIKNFHIDRFKREWKETIKKVVNNGKS